jgi:3-methyl-2-oxobutanoate hydroxymethyltransferase
MTSERAPERSGPTYPGPAENGATRAGRGKITVPKLLEMKRAGQPIVVLTAYDASFAAELEQAEIDVVLVGDSLGMVVQGKTSTLGVTLDDIAYHTAAVARGIKTALLIADVPYLAAASRQRATATALKLIGEAGAHMLKVEGAGAMLSIIEHLSERDTPVCAHLGLTPQSVLQLGGYKVQGRAAAEVEQLHKDARAVEAAGARLLVLECVPAALATEISQMLSIPVIGIGAGGGCDGQVLVLYDMLNISVGKRPRFSKDFLAGSGSIQGALAAYAAAVRERSFPAPEHSFI